MKKKILLLAAALMMFMGIVSASSINGDYKGNPIVKVMSNGKQLETDEVPAHIIDGHTLVPISTLRQLGASVTWDAYGYSVDVKLPSINTSSPIMNVNDDGIKKIKLYSKIANHYKKLSLLGDGLFALGNNFSLTYTAITTNKDGIGRLKYSSERATTMVNDYNEMLTDTATIINESQALGLTFDDMRDALSKYKTGLDYYTKSFQALNNLYYNNGSFNSNADSVFSNAKIADDSVDSAMRIMNNAYVDWYNKIQNY